jgi:hypothetical protein
MLNLGNWVPSLMAEISKEGMAIGFAWGGALVMFTSGVGRLSGGFLLMRFSSLRIVTGSMAILLASWFASINFGALFHLAARVTATDSYATLFGFINFLANLGAILFTLMFGLMKDTLGSFTWGFFILSLLALAAYILSRRGLRDDIVSRTA